MIITEHKSNSVIQRIKTTRALSKKGIHRSSEKDEEETDMFPRMSVLSAKSLAIDKMSKLSNLDWWTSHFATELSLVCVMPFSQPGLRRAVILLSASHEDSRQTRRSIN